MAITSGSFQSLYQVYYPQAELPYLVPQNLPLINMLVGGNSDGAVSGFITDMPWLLSPSVGVSQSFSEAQTQSNNAPTPLRPQVRLSQIYKLVDFSDKDELLSDGAASYGDLMENVVGGARNELLSNLDQLCHGAGSGIRCQVAAGVAVTTTTIPLTTQATETFFELNQRIVICSNAPTSGVPPTIVQGPLVVTNVSQTSITVNAVSGADIQGLYIAKAGDTMGFNTASLEPSLIGMDAYNPIVAPQPRENFLGVDRSVFSTRASGYRFDGSTRSSEAAIKRLATLMSQGGVNAGGAKVFMAPVDMDALEDKLASYQRFQQSQLGVFFFDSIALNSPLGRLEIMSDPHQTQGFARIYSPGGLQLQYRNGLPHLATLSGGVDQEFGQNFDGRSVRLRAYTQIKCLDPRKQGIVALPATV